MPRSGHKGTKSLWCGFKPKTMLETMISVSLRVPPKVKLMYYWGVKRFGVSEGLKEE